MSGSLSCKHYSALVDDSVKHEECNGRGAEKRELIARISADYVMVEQYGALREVDKYTEFTEEIQNLAPNR